jgi:sucrose-6-phosphate hydrolase SacC (GH32 family)
VGKFGLVVLSSGAEEYTAIAFDQARRHMLLDRSKSGPPGLLGNNDVRAGPWLGSSVDVLLHAYVDNQIVSFIANNETSISAWVDPTMASSRKVGLFAELSGDDSVELVSLDVWQLERASIEV